MSFTDVINSPPLGQVPHMGFRFGVFFFIGGVIPNVMDFRFKKVSGIGVSAGVANINEGGQNLFTHRVPDRLQYENLVLERGIPYMSPLAVEFNIAMSTFTFWPARVMIISFGEHNAPVASWLFLNAYPVSWKTTGLDADGGENNGLLIESMSLAYERMQTIRL